MKEELKKLLENSYSPYSKFRVSSIVVTNDGNIFKGVNVENASFGATICAERNAITNAITSGYTKNDFTKLYIMSDAKEGSMPCFMCRQVINEFFLPTSEVIIMNKEGIEKRFLVKDICPYPFLESDFK